MGIKNDRAMRTRGLEAAEHRGRAAAATPQLRRLEAALLEQLLQSIGGCLKSRRVRGDALQTREFIQARDDIRLMRGAVFLDLRFEFGGAGVERGGENRSTAGGDHPFHAWSLTQGAAVAGRGAGNWLNIRHEQKSQFSPRKYAGLPPLRFRRVGRG